MRCYTNGSFLLRYHSTAAAVIVNVERYNTRTGAIELALAGNLSRIPEDNIAKPLSPDSNTSILRGVLAPPFSTAEPIEVMAGRK